MSHALVELVEAVADGVARLAFTDMFREADVAIWTRRKLRKHATCVVLEERLKPGDIAWGPVGNQGYRYERIGDEGMRVLLWEAARRADSGKGDS